MTDTIRLNTLTPPPRKNRKRVGRGIGSGSGKTAGRGHKGQRARSGGRRDGGFEGGQMPLHRRVPKRGFSSRLARSTKEVRLSVLQQLGEDVVSLKTLHDKGILNSRMKRAKIFKSGGIERAITVSGIPVTRGARAEIEAAGGKVE